MKTDTMEELEIMRRQLAAMKRELDTRQIVNNNLMRRVMHSKASWLNRLVNAEIVALPILYILIAAICLKSDISQWYASVFIIIATADVALDIRTVRIPSHMFGTASIIELRKHLIRQKKERFIQTCVMLPVALIWLTAFVTAVFSHIDISPSCDLKTAAITGGIVGGIGGGIISIIVIMILYRKMQQTNDALLRDISDLEE